MTTRELPAALDGRPSRPGAGDVRLDRRRDPEDLRPQAAETMRPTQSRFVWRTDARHMLVSLSPELPQSLGRASALIGESLIDVLDRWAPGGSASIAAALQRQATWSEVVTPAAAELNRPEIELGGAPVYEARVFAGFRGYGVVRSAAASRSGRDAPERKGDAAVETKAPSAVSDGCPEEQCAPLDNVVRLRPSEAISNGKLEGNRPDRPQTVDAWPSAAADDETIAFHAIAAALGLRVGRGDRGTGRPVGSAPDVPRPAIPESAPAPAETEVALSAGEQVDPESSDNADTAAATRFADAMLDRLPIGILVMRGGVPLYLNRTLLDLLGYDDVEALEAAGGLSRLFAGRDLSSFDGTGAESRIALVATEGKPIELDARWEVLTWQGAPASLVCFRRSLEAEVAPRLQKLERQLIEHRDELAELKAVLNAATDGIAVLDAEGGILALNRAAEVLFGADQAAVRGRDFTVLLAPESHSIARTYFEAMRAQGVASLLGDGREVAGRERQGRPTPLFLTLGRLPASPAPRYCAVLRDVTGWKKAEQESREARRQAERANQLKSDFLARVSHEIRTPLNAILGFAEVIVEERFGPIGNERYKDYLKDIHASGAHLMSLVNDLLDLSKIEAGKMELNPVEVDANKVVAESVALMQPQAARERVIIRMALAPRLPQVHADERSLRQIVLNLLSNAVKFNEPGGQVLVSSATTETGQVVLRIRDTGIGMNESDLELALEPFRQLPTSRKAAGTGLGLPLTKALVEANRASFSIKSGRNKGTLVEIVFPQTLVQAAE